MLRHRNRSGAFTLIELLVVIGIIGLMVAIIVPSLAAARRGAKRTICASNLRQIGVASASYLIDFNEVFYWRGTDPSGNFDVSIYGMDWYVYGGRSTGNADNGQVDPATGIGLFNNTNYRPLNHYTNDNVEVFRCPLDTDPEVWASGNTHYDYVGNSYEFNAIGYPNATGPTTGLDARRLSDIRKPSQTVVYFDTSMHKAPGAWHGVNGNLMPADWHVDFTVLPTDTDPYYTWDP